MDPEKDRRSKKNKELTPDQTSKKLKELDEKLKKQKQAIKRFMERLEKNKDDNKQ
jgi:hypothetical protein